MINECNQSIGFQYQKAIRFVPLTAVGILIGESGDYRGILEEIDTIARLCWILYFNFLS